MTLKKRKILCTICARKGSTGVKNKALRLLRGKPLIFYTINKALKSKLFSEVVVSTDCNKIKKSAIKYGAKCWFLRNKKISTKFSPKKLALIDLLSRAEKKFKTKFDIIVDLDVSCPLRNINDLKLSLKKFILNRADILISVNECRKNPYYNMVEYKNNKIAIVKQNQDSSKHVARQLVPKVYEMNASIHIRKREILLDKKNLKMKFSKKSMMYLMPKERSIDIDTEYDFLIIKKILK